MLSVGWPEMFIIAVVALIVVGPRDLPVMLNQLGKALGVVRRMGNDFRREIKKAAALDEVTDLRKSIAGPFVRTREDIEREFNTKTASGTSPSGALKPKDPEAESVVAEIHQAAGMPDNAKAAGANSAKPTAPTTQKTAAKSTKPTAARKAAPGAKPVKVAKSSASAPAKPVPSKTAAAKPAPAGSKKTSISAASAKPAATKPAAAKTARTNQPSQAPKAG